VKLAIGLGNQGIKEGEMNGKSTMVAIVLLVFIVGIFLGYTWRMKQTEQVYDKAIVELVDKQRDLSLRLNNIGVRLYILEKKLNERERKTY